ncbi:DMT family transporter [Candidatus Microgenomates bacterium]|nr:DMT family transporter [Candidatus Microgenomates bacterium]
MPSNSKKRAIIALVIAALIWGAAVPIFKWSLGNIPPFSLAFLRFFLAAFLIFPLAKNHLKISSKDIDRIVLISLLGITLNISFFFQALRYTTALNAAVLLTTAPILTLFTAHIFLKERLRPILILSLSLAVLGMIVLIINPIRENGIDSHLLGNFLMLLAVLSWVGYEITAKKLFVSYPAITIVFYSFLIGAFSFFPGFYAEYIMSPEWVLDLDIKGIVGIAYGAFFSSTIAYLAWDFGLSKLPASEVSLFSSLQPLAAAVIALPLLGEKITFPFLIGAFLILTGVFLLEKKRLLTHSRLQNS